MEHKRNTGIGADRVYRSHAPRWYRKRYRDLPCFAGRIDIRIITFSNTRHQHSFGQGVWIIIPLIGQRHRIWDSLLFRKIHGEEKIMYFPVHPGDMQDQSPLRHHIFPGAFRRFHAPFHIDLLKNHSFLIKQAFPCRKVKNKKLRRQHSKNDPQYGPIFLPSFIPCPCLYCSSFSYHRFLSLFIRKICYNDIL